MLDHEKMREIRAVLPGLEFQESDWKNYERIVILRALEFFQELQEAGGLARFIDMADRAEPEPAALPSAYSMTAAPIETDSSSDFLLAVNGKDPDRVWTILDDHMDTLRQLNERAYNSIMRKICEI